MSRSGFWVYVQSVFKFSESFIVRVLDKEKLAKQRIGSQTVLVDGNGFAITLLSFEIVFLRQEDLSQDFIESCLIRLDCNLLINPFYGPDHFFLRNENSGQSSEGIGVHRIDLEGGFEFLLCCGWILIGQISKSQAMMGHFAI